MRLRGSVHDRAHARASAAPRSCGSCCNDEPFVNALGALTGNQAMQQVKAGLKAIYLSGWQVAADANIAGEMYPDQSLYPVNSVPHGRAGASTTRSSAPTRSSTMEGNGRHRLLRADRRRRRSRLRRRAERLRADEGDDRSRRRRRALRGPARLGQEVRPHGRQGAGADARSGREAGRRAPRGRRAWACRRSCSRAPTPKRPTS